MTQQIIFNVTYHIVYVIVTFVLSLTFATLRQVVMVPEHRVKKDLLLPATQVVINSSYLLGGAMATQVIQICSARAKSYF